MDVPNSSNFIKRALLATVELRASGVLLEQRDNMGLFRALCDSGSQVNLITENSVRVLNIRRESSTIIIRGIGADSSEQCRGTVTVLLFPHFESDEYLMVDFLIVPKITMTLPNIVVPKEQKNFVSDLVLADPRFDVPGRIDMLLGAGIWANMMRQGIITGPGGMCIQKTFFGWMAYGAMGECKSNSVGLVHFGTAEEQISESEEQLNTLMRRLWEVDDVRKRYVSRSPDEILADELFEQTHHRTETGRFVVRILFRPDAPALGDSRRIAVRRFLALEKQLESKPEMKAKWLAFMREYQALGHMRRAVRPPTPGLICFYVPYHCIDNKKFRVVFDGSCKTSNGLSLNDIQLTGRKLQRDLAEILISFRWGKEAATADIVKMFRQVEIHPTHWDAQRIVYRENPNDPLEDMWLLVATYGFRSSLYLSVASTKKAADLSRAKFPIAAQTIDEDGFVDDYLMNAENEADLMEKCSQTSHVLADSGFELAKWRSTCPEVQKKLSKNDDAKGDLPLESDEVSILGLKWNHVNDTFSFKVRARVLPDVITKRTVASEAAKLYDPNGFLGPVVIVGKLFIQELWRIGIDWDQSIPTDLRKRWIEFYESLSLLEELKIPRWLGTNSKDKIELHVFVDASSVGYGAVVYVRTIRPDGEILTALITSKTRVAPVKTLSIPRLELCAAELGGFLLEHVQFSLKLQRAKVILWSDSMVVLHWIRKLPCTLKTFVANRVSSIQEYTSKHR